MSNEHTVKSYEEELRYLIDSVIKMGSLTESQMVDSMDAVIKVDKDSIDKIIKSDEEINKYRSKIDTQILTLLVKRAPMAIGALLTSCLLYTSPSPRDRQKSRMPSSA